MWLSKRNRQEKPVYTSGTVSIEGENCAVAGFTESRGAEVFAPGGYIWKPALGDSVLVFKDGSADIIGKKCPEADIQPGEVCIKSLGGAEIYLRNDGTVIISGNVIFEGDVKYGNEA